MLVGYPMLHLASCVWLLSYFLTFLKREAEAQGGNTCRRFSEKGAALPPLFHFESTLSIIK